MCNNALISVGNVNFFLYLKEIFLKISTFCSHNSAISMLPIVYFVSHETFTRVAHTFVNFAQLF